jgi:heme-degrading monooxygenase HmoA
MILEVAVFTIKKGQGPAFEQAMAKAKKVISASPGFRNLKISASIDWPYMLRVCWNRLETTRSFANPAVQEWRALSGFFDGPPWWAFNSPFETVAQQWAHERTHPRRRVVAQRPEAFRQIWQRRARPWTSSPGCSTSQL